MYQSCYSGFQGTKCRVQICTRFAVVVASNDLNKECVTSWECWMNKEFFYVGWELEVLVLHCMLIVFKFLYPSVHVIQINLFSIFHCGAVRMDCIFRGIVFFFYFTY